MQQLRWLGVKAPDLDRENQLTLKGIEGKNDFERDRQRRIKMRWLLTGMLLFGLRTIV